jgi:hypothetical protein
VIGLAIEVRVSGNVPRGHGCLKSALYARPLPINISTLMNDRPLRSLPKHYLANSAPIRHVFLSKQSCSRLGVDSLPQSMIRSRVSLC